MPQILFVQSTPPAGFSADMHTKATHRMASALKRAVRTPLTHIVDRDVSVKPPLLIDSYWKTASRIPEEKRTHDQKLRLKESDELVGEVLHSDVIVVSCPEYEYGVPAPLSAWLDNIVRPGKTCYVSPLHPSVKHGLLGDKRVVMLVSSAAMKKKNAVRANAEEVVKRRFEELGVKNFDLINSGNRNEPDSETACKKIESIAKQIRAGRFAE